MKRKIFIIVLLLVVINCIATAEEPRNNESVIQVKHHFHGWTHCSHRATPSWKSGCITIGENDTVIAGYEGEINVSTEHNISKPIYYHNGDLYLDDNYNNKLLLSVKSVANNMNCNEYTSEPKQLKIGYNYIPEHEQVAKCWWNKKEGYTVSSVAIVDIPVYTTVENTNTDLNVDEDKVHLKFGDFYDYGERWIEYRISNGDWKRVDNKNIAVTPNGEVQLSHTDIFGSFSSKDVKFLSTLAKKVDFKVVKRMIDGITSSSCITKPVRFYLKAPDFTIRTSYLTCNGVRLIVKISDEDYINDLDNYTWYVATRDDEHRDSVLSSNPNLSSAKEVDHFEQIDEGEYILFLPDKVNFLSDLNELENQRAQGNVNICVQLGTNNIQYDNDNNNNSIPEFRSNDHVKIPETIAKISGSQKEPKNLLSGVNPHIYIDIIDSDKERPKGRVPYKIYDYSKDTKGALIKTIVCKNERQAKSLELDRQIFNGKNPQYSYGITKEQFTKEAFHNWYVKNSGSPITKTIKSNETITQKETQQSGSLTNFDILKQGNYLCFTKDGGNSWYGLELSGYPTEFNGIPSNKTIGSDKYNLENRQLKKNSQLQSVSPLENNNFIKRVGAYILGFVQYSNNTYLNIINIEKTNRNDVCRRINNSSSYNNINNLSKDNIYINAQTGEVNLLNGNEVLYYKDGTEKRYNTCLAASSINNVNVSADRLLYKYDNQVYKQTPTLSEESLYAQFKNDNALIPSTYFNKDWEKFSRERDYYFYEYLSKYYYRIDNLAGTYTRVKGIIKYTGKIIIQDGDGCDSDPIPYEVSIPDLKFDYTITKYPSKFDSSDGTASLKFKEGGLSPYKYNGAEITNNAFTVTGLKFGDNTIDGFVDTEGNDVPYIINIPFGNVSVSKTDIKCGTQGSITITKTDNSTIPNKFCIRQVDGSTEIENAVSGTTYNLGDGQYNIYAVISRGDNTSSEEVLLDTQTIDDKAFKATFVEKNDAETIGGDGRIIFHLDNYVGQVSYSINGKDKTQATVKNGDVAIVVKKGKYTVKFYNGNGCDYQVSETKIVDGPSIGTASFNLSSETKKDGTKKQNVTVQLNNIEGITDYCFILKGNGQEYQIPLQKTINESCEYEVCLKYKTSKDSENKTHTLKNGLRFLSLGAFGYAISQPKCTGKDGYVTFNNYSQGQKYSIDNNNYADITNKPISVPIGKNSIWIKEVSVSAQGDVRKTAIVEKNIEINEPPKYTCSVVTETDHVTCNGGNDGVIAISDEINKDGKGTFTYTLYNASGTKTDKVLQNGKFSGLSAGAYKVVISSNECGVLMTVEDELSISNPTKLQVSSKVLADPTCREDDGAIKITDINGGSGKYRLMYSNKALQQSNNTLYNPSNNTEITDEIKYSKENILDYGEYGEECAECTEENAIPELLTKTIDKKEYEIKGLPHGNYYLLVYDSYGCVYQSEKINLKRYINPRVTLAESAPTTCNGYSDGAINIKNVETNGKLNDNDVLVKTIKYRVSQVYDDRYNGLIGEEKTLDYNKPITGLPAGDYRLWLVDNNDCQSDESYPVSVTQPNPITLEAYKRKDVTAFGGNDGEVQLYAKGGNNCDKSIYVLKHELSEPEQTQAEEQPEVQDSAPDDNEPQQPENTPAATQESVPEILDDECAIDESVLRDNYYTITQYKFDKGRYTFQVRDVQNGCLSNVTEPIEIKAPDAPVSATTKVNRALCFNETGSVIVTPEGGWGKPYKVTLNRLAQKVDSASVNANTDKATFANLLSGTYTLEITDKLGGKYTTTVDVPMPNKAITFSNSTFVAERCEADGEAHIVIDGGSGTFTTNLLGQSYSEPQIDVTNMKSGFYTLHTIDANKCESMYNFEIPDERLSVELKQYHTPEQGTVIEAEVANGTAPYTYEWNRVDAEEAVLRGGAEPVGNKITGIVQGIYSLKLTDFKGCERKAVTDMLTDGSRRMRVVELQRETHPDVADGYVVLASDTTINFVSKQLYHLQSESFTNIESDFADGKIRIDNLRGGDYVVKFALSDGRLRTAQFNIAPYEPMTIDTLALRHVSLPHRADGVLKFNVNGGIAPFTVSTTHTTDQSYVHKLLSADSRYFAVDSLIAGEYEVQVTDSTGNKTEIEFKVIEPEDLVLKCDSRTPASCYGYSDGEVSLSARGGWGKYQFAEANGSYSRVSSFRGLSAGGMSFEVIDKYGTVAKLRVYIDQPDSLKFTLAQVDSVSCYKLNDGAISFDVTGGNGGYEMLYTNDEKYNPDKWSPYRNDTTALTHLTSGNYQVSFTDQNGCYAYDTMEVFVPQPDELVISDFQVTHTTCDTDNGRIQITTEGGSLPYRYSWVENGETDIASTNVDAHNNQIVNLKQDGLYQVGITDLHGCATEGTYRIDHSSKPKVSAVSTVDVTCFGLSDGIAAVDSAQVVYGYPWSPFTLTWPQGQNNTMSVNTLPTGEYYVRITDGNDCVDSTLFAVGTPEPVKLSLVGTRDAHCYGYEDGQIDVAAHGGVGEYVFVWDRGDTDSSIKNIGKGRYHVTVNDAHNCVDTASYSIDEPDKLLVDLGDDALICPQGHHVFDGGEYNTYEWYKVGESEVIEFGRYLAVGEEGDYRIVVTDRDGCFARDTVRLSIGENALVADFLMASDASLADTVMIVRIVNMPLDSLRWENVYDFKEIVPEETKEHLLYLRPQKVGTYNITLKAYSGGCEAMQTKEIEIFETLADDTDFDITYNPLIKSVKATPNPNDGNFTLNIELREAHECSVRINSVIAGHTVDSRKLSGADRYAESYDISGFGNGLYVMSVEAGKERRVMKLLVKSK